METINSGRHPFEVVALVGSVAVGLSSALGRLMPLEVAQHTPLWFDACWGVGFTAGSLIALVGLRVNNRCRGVFLEQVGLATLSALCFMYAAIVLAIASATYFPIVFLFLMLGVACLIQWVRIEIVVRAVIRRGYRIEERVGE